MGIIIVNMICNVAGTALLGRTVSSFLNMGKLCLEDNLVNDNMRVVPGGSIPPRPVFYPTSRTGL